MNDESRSETPSIGHEPIEASVRAVWITGAALTGVVIGTFLVILGLQAWLEKTHLPQEAAAETKTDPDWNAPPQVQVLKTKEQEFLTTYQWVDERAGVARIPLDRALEIITADGLPEMIGTNTNPATQNMTE